MSDNKELDIDEIEKRANAATPGPWTVTEDRAVLSARIPFTYEDGLSAYDWELFRPEEGEPSRRVIVETDSGVYPPQKCDAEFIAHARSDIPNLIAEVRRLRAELFKEWLRNTDAEKMSLQSEIDRLKCIIRFEREAHSVVVDRLRAQLQDGETT